MHRLGLLLLSALLLPPALAQELPIEVAVVVQGQEAPSQLEKGYRTVRAEQGTAFKVRLTNTSGERVFVVVAVDGKNPGNAKSAFLGQRGYILEAGENKEIAGWNSKKHGLTPFRFEGLRSIDYAVFHEDPHPVVFTPWTPATGKPKPFYGVEGETPRLYHMQYEAHPVMSPNADLKAGAP